MIQHMDRGPRDGETHGCHIGKIRQSYRFRLMRRSEYHTLFGAM
ncbi:hypothetical protein DSM110093_03658 (plasmid) [Sulfitobacter sp. DSM 110093]|nr:hypothetical protein DSM110093_03658 [Sulfitobacter sp. DSM 110093]